MILLTVVLAVACGGGGKKSDATNTGGTGGMETKSLYDRLGGKDAITAVVDEFVANVAADTRINAMFANADIKNLKSKLVDQICEATGGPCKYTGKNMKDAHTGMNIKEADFNALVEDLVKALDKFKVPEKEKGELLGALGGMKADIVTAK
ncbi:MAG: group 1 truncated hemoglobin [Myxococcota bacterium]|nr:group 1 truncated hemoglobin [Myxococcota bacterium]